MRYLFFTLFVLSSLALADNNSGQFDLDLYDQKLDSLKRHTIGKIGHCRYSYHGHISNILSEYIYGLHKLNSEFGSTTESLFSLGTAYAHFNNIDSMVYYFDSAATVYYVSLHRVYDSYVRCINDDMGDCQSRGHYDKSHMGECLMHKLRLFDTLNAEYDMTGLGAYYIGVIFLELNKMDSAFSYLDSALVMCRNDMDVPGQKICSQNHFDLKVRHIRRDCSEMWFEKAGTLLDECQQVLELMNRDIDADSMEILIHLYNRGINSAYEALEQAIAAIPMNLELHDDMTEEITAKAKELIIRHMDRAPLADFVYGSLLMRSGEYESAKSYLERYIASPVDDSERIFRARKLVFECIQAIHSETGRWY